MIKLLSIAAIAALCSAAIGQGPLTTTYVDNNGGGVGGGIFFDLTVDPIAAPTGLTLISLDLNVVGDGSINVWVRLNDTHVLNEQSNGGWTNVSSGTVTGGVGGVPTPVVGFIPIPLPVGTHGVAIETVGVSHRYTNGNGTNQVHADPNGELTLTAGTAMNTPFTAATVFTPRVVNCTLDWGLGTSGVVAMAAPYGEGCYEQYRAQYQYFPMGTAPDLAGLGFTMTPIGPPDGGYVVSPATVPYLAPTAAASSLLLTDDAEVQVALPQPFNYPGGSTNSLTVCSNGFVSVATGNGVSFAPNIAELLANPQTSWRYHHDFNPTAPGSGDVKFELVGNIMYITWDGVRNFGGTTSADDSTFQFAFDLASDLVHCNIVSTVNSGNDHIVAYSPGTASVNADSGGIDIDVVLGAGGITLTQDDTSGLSLGTSARPIEGTAITHEVGNIPTTAGGGFLFYGFSQATVSAASLGMPGCFQYTDLGSAVFFPTLGSTASVPYDVPTGYQGIQFSTQAAVLVNGVNPLGAISSNGVRFILGNL